MEFLNNLLHTFIGLFWIILGFGALIFIHELGHFLAAKWAGIRAEAFAVGMGPVVLAWRKGIGLRYGSTLKEYEKRAREHIKSSGENTDATDADKELSVEDIYRAGDALGLGETEYSLRWIPMGGFVKMLGQEDANPNYVSDDARSYNSCPIGKRMIVVSAGVVMNVILAALLFIWAFMVGVKFPAPVVGDVSSTMSAGTTMADNAEALGISTVGLQPGDLVTHIDGEPAHTFMDIQIASAMSREDQNVVITVERDGFAEPLQFTLSPKHDPNTGMRSIGLAPARTTTLIAKDEDDVIENELTSAGLDTYGIKPGMRLLTANDQIITTVEQLQGIARQSNGAPITTTWSSLDDDGDLVGELITAPLPVEVQYQILLYPELSEDNVRDFDFGLLGLTMLVQISDVLPGSLNEGILQSDDVVLRIDDIEGPRRKQLIDALADHKREELELEVLREGVIRTLTVKVNNKGKLDVVITPASDVPLIAQPFIQLASRSGKNQPIKAVSSPVAELNLMPRTRIEEINGHPVDNWRDLWMAFRDQTRTFFENGTGGAVDVTFTNPTIGGERETLSLTLSEDNVRGLHELQWQCGLSTQVFDAIYTVRSAEGDPIKAMVMGVQETHKAIVMVYLTIDRLIRGTVGIEQMRGPLGIIDVGIDIFDRGFIYLLFFLGMISANLAVINFLPIPIVDGGLFLFLIYEKLKGKPPSVAFQNVATIVGVCFIGTLIIVVTYNDILRILS